MIYLFKDYLLDENRHELRRAGKTVSVEPKVFQVLVYLLQNRDRVVPKQELFEQCWPDTFVSDSALTRCLTKLRRAVHTHDGADAIIKTMHRHGYHFVADVAVSPQSEPSSDRSCAASVEATPSPLAAARPSQDGIALKTLSVSVAERRQLTVLSCALTSIAQLAEQLDPEDLHQIIRTFHNTCKTIIEPFAGYIAQRLEDGVLVYFGYPKAYEDNARRAIRAGLALVETPLRSLIAQAHVPEDALAMHVGVHTGVTVIEPPSDEGDPLPLAIGSTSLIAVGLRALAAPATVVVSEATAQLVEGYFVQQALGTTPLPGQLQPLALYHIVGERKQQTPLDVAAVRGLTPFVGRTAELALFQERWHQAQDGLGQVIVLSGEAGIGKSRLVRAFREAIVEEGLFDLECRCSSYHQHTPLYPVTNLFRQLLQLENAATEADQLEALERLVQQTCLSVDEDESVSLLAPLLGLSLPANRYPPLAFTSQQKRQRGLETLLAIVLALAKQRPALFIVEDLHWIDPTTLEWLGLLIDQGPTTSLTTLLTCRPTFQSPWGGRSHLTSLTLHRLARHQVIDMVQKITRNVTLPPSVIDKVISTTDGVPLFVEEVTKLVIASDQVLRRDDSNLMIDSKLMATIPTTLQDSLMARLDQMGSAKSTAQLGAVIGREFSHFLIQAVSPLSEKRLGQELKKLVAAEVLSQHGVGEQVTYVFRHALIQEVAYTALLRQVRQVYHLKIGKALEEKCPDLVTLHPELVAHHYTQAKLNKRAVGYWLQAGQHARKRSAHQEAISHLINGLEVLSGLPESSERAHQEFSFQLALGSSQIQIHGYGAPIVEQTFTHARELGQQVGETSQLFSMYVGLRASYLTRGELKTAQAINHHLFKIAQDCPQNIYFQSLGGCPRIMTANLLGPGKVCQI